MVWRLALWEDFWFSRVAWKPMPVSIQRFCHRCLTCLKWCHGAATLSLSERCNWPPFWPTHMVIVRDLCEFSQSLKVVPSLWVHMRHLNTHWSNVTPLPLRETFFSLKRFGGSQWRCCCSRPQPWPRELLQFSWRMVRRSFNILFGLESVSLAIWFSLMDLMAYYVLEICNTDETVVGIEFSHAFKSSWPRSQLKGSSLLWRVMLSRTCTRSCRVMIFGHDIEATTFFCWSNRVAREVIWL